MWQTFVRYPHLADGRHDDEAWRAHSGRFAACLIRIPASALQPNLNTFREAVGPLGLSRLHPDHFLHIMVQEIGFVTRNPTTPDELSLDRFDELGSALGSALNDIEQFDVVVRGVNSFEDAAFLEVHDGGRCQMLHKRLREVAAVPLIPRYAFLPHITIAHYLGVFDSMPIVQALQPFRESEFGIVRISEVEIVTFRV
ncbi:MAG TPA: 2'-5' RNA ligase family protein, partial [Thermomicrobiales bacterium]|nr:2'-5' RNA ligase family protein [Thermomicrobiales bacterium]